MRPTRPQHSAKYQSAKPQFTRQRVFEIDINTEAQNNFQYFIEQELGYYNTLVNQLTPRLRAFPQELLSIKDREKKLWDVCAEHAVHPQQVVDHNVEAWPQHLQHLGNLVKDSEGNNRISSAHVNIIGIAASPARLHGLVRKNLATEVLKHMQGQSDVMLAAQSTEGLRAPLQLLQTETLDTKRHLQIPASLVKITYDAENEYSVITVPYSKSSITVHRVNLTEIPFKSMIIRSPHKNTKDGKWVIDLRDAQGYLLNVADQHERLRKPRDHEKTSPVAQRYNSNK